jgi:hypothetical protein
LHDKVLKIDVAGAFGRAGGIDHVDGGLVVFVKDRGSGLGKTEFVKDSAEMLRDFGGACGSDEFGFSGAGGDGGLDLGLVGNGGTGKAEAEAGDGATSARAGGVGSIDEASEFERRKASRETRKGWIGRKSGLGRQQMSDQSAVWRR